MEVVHFMLNNKGSTLIESLFAFEIYVGIFIVCISLLVMLYQNEMKLDHRYQVLIQKESEIIYQQNFYDIVKKVLH